MAQGVSLFQLIAHKPPRPTLREKALGWWLIGGFVSTLSDSQ